MLRRRLGTLAPRRGIKGWAHEYRAELSSSRLWLSSNSHGVKHVLRHGVLDFLELVRGHPVLVVLSSSNMASPSPTSPACQTELARRRAGQLLGVGRMGGAAPSGLIVLTPATDCGTNALLQGQGCQRQRQHQHWGSDVRWRGQGLSDSEDTSESEGRRH